MDEVINVSISKTELGYQVWKDNDIFGVMVRW